MRGGSLTRFKPDPQSGNGLMDLIGSSVKDILGTAALGGWEGLKGSKCLRDVKTNTVKGFKEGLKRGVKRKAKEVFLKEIVKRTKPLTDIFGD